MAYKAIKKITIKYGFKSGLGGMIYFADGLKSKWVKQQSSIKEYDLTVPKYALDVVTSWDKEAVYASGDTLFRGAVFGRDSLEVAEDLLDESPQLTRNILKTLASLQGTEFNEQTEEELGKIAHEHRDRPTDDTGKLIFEELTSRWGSKNGNLTYYGSVDATPLYIRLVCEYVQKYGPEILKANVNRNGHTVTIQQTLNDALTWLANRLHKSSTGLLEYCSLNPKGIENQVWKDSIEFYVHENGELVNHNSPIASIEVQGLAYDALWLAGEMGISSHNNLKNIAWQLRDRTIALLWQPDAKYFALGLDYDALGNLRQIKTKAANPAALLDTRFFDDLNQLLYKKYVSAIVETIMGSDFLTDAGIRSRALSMAKVIDYWDYHGSHTTWPKETNDIARGLRRQGFIRLAMQLENRLLNAVKRADTYPEFVYIDDSGQMLTDVFEDPNEDFVLVNSTNKPESLQAWTISSVVRILDNRYGNKVQPNKQQADYWKFKLEWKILNEIQQIQHIHKRMELKAKYPHKAYKLQRAIKPKSDGLNMGKFNIP